MIEEALEDSNPRGSAPPPRLPVAAVPTAAPKAALDRRLDQVVLAGVTPPRGLRPLVPLRLEKPLSPGPVPGPRADITNPFSKKLVLPPLA
ncbi:MAG TPA: hypothetical protein VGO62_04185, partial [Myxococcota bacterium]